MRRVLVATLMAFLSSVAAAETADLVIVKKSESKLFLMRGGKELASFRVVFGGEPHGHKQQEGDERTPEGKYVLDAKNAASGYYKAIHISYPNANDVANAKARGVDPGGLIMIHGQRNGWVGLRRSRSGSTGPTAALHSATRTWKSCGTPCPRTLRSRFFLEL